MKQMLCCQKKRARKSLEHSTECSYDQSDIEEEENEFGKCNLILWREKIKKKKQQIGTLYHISTLRSIPNMVWILYYDRVEFYEAICRVNNRRWCHSHSLQFINAICWKPFLVEMEPIFSIDFSHSSIHFISVRKIKKKKKMHMATENESQMHYRY